MCRLCAGLSHASLPSKKNDIMLRSTVFICASLVAIFAANAQQALSINGQMIPLKCEEWKKIGDSTWTTVGTIKAGSITMSGVTVSHDKESEALDKACQ
jgi:hypothetical protein